MSKNTLIRNLQFCLLLVLALKTNVFANVGQVQYDLKQLPLFFRAKHLAKPKHQFLSQHRAVNYCGNDDPNNFSNLHPSQPCIRSAENQQSANAESVAHANIKMDESTIYEEYSNLDYLLDPSDRFSIVENEEPIVFQTNNDKLFDSFCSSSILDNGNQHELFSVQENRIENVEVAISPKSAITIHENNFVYRLVFSLFICAIIVTAFEWVRRYPQRLTDWLHQNIAIHEYNNHIEGVVQLLSQTIPEYERVFGKFHSRTRFFKLRLAIAFIQCNCCLQAASLLKELRDFQVKKGPLRGLFVLDENLGRAFLAMNEYSYALKYLFEALENCITEHGVSAGLNNNSTLTDHDREIVQTKINASSILERPDETVDISSTPPQRYEDVLRSDYSTFSTTLTSDASPDDTIEADYNRSQRYVRVYQNLDEAFLAESDFNIHDIIRDEYLYAETIDGDFCIESHELHNVASSIEKLVFCELVELPHGDYSRICRLIGDVYGEMKDFIHCLLFYCNALEILKRLPNEAKVENQCQELKALIYSTKAKLFAKPVKYGTELFTSYVGCYNVTQMFSTIVEDKQILMPLKVVTSIT